MHFFHMTLHGSLRSLKNSFSSDRSNSITDLEDMQWLVAFLFSIIQQQQFQGHQPFFRRLQLLTLSTLSTIKNGLLYHTRERREREEGVEERKEARVMGTPKVRPFQGK